MLALPRHFPSRMMPSQSVEKLVLKHLQLPSFKEFIRCICLIRPRELRLNGVTFVEDDIDTYIASPPPRDRTRPLVEGHTCIKGKPSIPHLSSYCKFMALVHASGDSDMNRARALAAQNISRLSEAIAGDSSCCITELHSEHDRRQQDEFYAFRGVLCAHGVRITIAFYVDEQTGLVNSDAVWVTLPTDFEWETASATLIDFDGLDRVLTELASPTTPPIHIYCYDRHSLKQLLRSILDDGHLLSRTLAHLSRTRQITLGQGPRVVDALGLTVGPRILDTLRELLPAPLRSSVTGWQTAQSTGKDQIHISWIFEVLKVAWSAEDLETVLHALDPSPDVVSLGDPDAVERELVGNSGSIEKR
ncbi:hypothetical protein PsYK624_100330 [Phanerochaete sordida]|uniref:Uncharacterized protein n=1 Tax=Phanerochaete sordida TaxID=48140 RepID=A0A9P3LGK0_9APHY|nr:hypothetical protein PsYK624_100330 [Phanerochaete sordida]